MTMRTLSSGSDYARLMLFRAPNPQMHKCRQCGRRWAAGGIPCCSARLIYDSMDGPARRVRDTDGQDIYISQDYWLELKREGKL